MESNKHKQTSRTVSEKLDAVDRIRKGESQANVCRNLGKFKIYFAQILFI